MPHGIKQRSYSCFNIHFYRYDTSKYSWSFVYSYISLWSTDYHKHKQEENQLDLMFWLLNAISKLVATFIGKFISFHIE